MEKLKKLKYSKIQEFKKPPTFVDRSMQHDQPFPSARYFLSLIVDDFSTCSILFFFFFPFFFIFRSRSPWLGVVNQSSRAATSGTTPRPAIQCEGSRLKVRNNLNCYFYRTVEYFFSWFPTSKRGQSFEFSSCINSKLMGTVCSRAIQYVQPRRRLMITLLDMVRLYGCNLENESRKCF